MCPPKPKINLPPPPGQAPPPATPGADNLALGAKDRLAKGLGVLGKLRLMRPKK